MCVVVCGVCVCILSYSIALYTIVDCLHTGEPQRGAGEARRRWSAEARPWKSRRCRRGAGLRGGARRRWRAGRREAPAEARGAGRLEGTKSQQLEQMHQSSNTTRLNATQQGKARRNTTSKKANLTHDHTTYHQKRAPTATASGHI